MPSGRGSDGSRVSGGFTKAMVKVKDVNGVGCKRRGYGHLTRVQLNRGRRGKRDGVSEDSSGPEPRIERIMIRWVGIRVCVVNER